MTASALLTVVGVALVMEAVGLSAALGSFIAGALLAGFLGQAIGLDSAANGAGFIGAHLSNRLLAQGHSVTAYDNFCNGQRWHFGDNLNNPRLKIVEADVRDEARLDADSDADLAALAQTLLAGCAGGPATLAAAAILRDALADKYLGPKGS